MTITFLDLNHFFDRFLSVFSLYYDWWSNKLFSTVCFHSIHLAHLSEGHCWAECGSVCFLSVKEKGAIFNPINRKIIGQLIDYQNNR